jgi:catechol 2,3-dioxygenase-like lactoylglutathione lyase family enzyme
MQPGILKMSPQTYVMPMYVRLMVADVEATKAWYHEALGFESVFDIPHTMAHLRGRRYQDVLIVKGEAGKSSGVTLSFTWSKSVDALAEDVKAAGGKILDGPVDRPWNARELVIEDPNGYRLSFSQAIEHREMEEVLSGGEAE